MLEYVIGEGVIQYEGKTKEQAFERHRKMCEHNEWVDQQLEKWKPVPAKFYQKWCRKYAPHLLKTCLVEIVNASETRRISQDRQ